jgi:hypothetical protein
MPAWPPPAIRGHPQKRTRRLGMGVDVAEAVAAGDGFLHRALLYRGAAEFRAGGTVHMWHDAEEVFCQITDSGVIADRLAGYRVPADDLRGGKGLWLVNQVCDLVEMRSTTDGTQSACT